MKHALYTLVQATWGFPQTLAGLGVCLANVRRPHFRYHGAVVTPWKHREGLSLGLFVFLDGSYEGEGSVAVLVDEQGGAFLESDISDGVGCPENAETVARIDRRLLVHEYGHTIQSLMLGPAYLVVVGLPSLLWAKLPAAARRHQHAEARYYAFAPERFANWLGERVLKELSF